MTTEHPLRPIMRDWLPEIDFGVLSHGFLEHGRDYRFVLQAGGTYELTLTHVVELNFETRVRDDVWPESWDDVFTDYGAWTAVGHPGGNVFGARWSLGYPGLEAPEENPLAQKWSNRLGHRMHYVSMETDLFRIAAIFHNARAEKLSDKDAPLNKVLISL